MIRAEMMKNLDRLQNLTDLKFSNLPAQRIICPCWQLIYHHLLVAEWNCVLQYSLPVFLHCSCCMCGTN
ncbi:hypothetical protein COCON_G00145180 [Conger conger]|uniref:Uncharacterized protein n=1 Tax=Conger conger TaxID=82655 RepID=A0A9Q1DC35_CONCO|nr:hypothetical protein COCON_G00145180 [Conger conger]